MEVVASLSQGLTAAAQCGLFTYKSVPVIFEPPCISYFYNILEDLTCPQHRSKSLKYRKCRNALSSIDIAFILRYKSVSWVYCSHLRYNAAI